MKNLLKITYLIDNDGMTDTEFENQPERELVVTSEMLKDLIREHDKTMTNNDFVESDYITITKL